MCGLVVLVAVCGLVVLVAVCGLVVLVAVCGLVALVAVCGLIVLVAVCGLVVYVDVLLCRFSTSIVDDNIKILMTPSYLWSPLPANCIVDLTRVAAGL